MKLIHAIPALAAIAMLSACSSQVDAAADAAKNAANDVTNAATNAVDTAKEATLGPDISTLPSGVYKSDNTHAYLAFKYSHADYSVPILMWDNFDVTIDLNAESPESSNVNVSIATDSIDAGSDIWTDKLKGADWFDVENHPTITFTGTNINQAILGNGTLTGDLTLKGITKPVTLDVKLNKVGEHFRTKAPMFGISATGTMNRADFGIDKFMPTGDVVTLQIEVEFQKEG